MSGKRALHVEPEPRLRTFDEWAADFTLTQPEREALVWHLATFRARKTIDALLPVTDPRLGGCRTDVRKNVPLTNPPNDQQRDAT